MGPGRAARAAGNDNISAVVVDVVSDAASWKWHLVTDSNRPHARTGGT